MSQILAIVRGLLKRREYLISRHGYRELEADDILLEEVLAGIESAVVVEEYPDSRKEPSVLVLQRDGRGLPIHVMWGVPKNSGAPAVLVTAYRPATERWSPDFIKRKKP
ncbi:MAG TPA: DUF4258 domain-containing protein [Bradyrhizobium sp.]|uniref:DUF4258 domain-containing protein n=1 Tax=Bradyrhizobium sp. TaxID=376 RepID=UPI002BF8C000|nr:DUF4258 domain-containing protein [Bradyrhizobium sp.]HTB00408.1 DUF4258 domain-containing protein [Bradyrhizobium sp.]